MINICVKQHSFNVWPPFMLISWKCWVLYEYFNILEYLSFETALSRGGRKLLKFIFFVQVHHQTTFDNLLKFCVTPGHFIFLWKTTLHPSFASVDILQKATNWCSKLVVTLVYRTNAAKSHSFGDKDLKN